MIQKGADIEARNKWGETPLHNTAKRGNLESSIYLLNNGADIQAIDTFGETGKPSHLLIYHGAYFLPRKLCTRHAALEACRWLTCSSTGEPALLYQVIAVRSGIYSRYGISDIYFLNHSLPLLTGTPLTVAMTHRQQPVIEFIGDIFKHRSSDRLNGAIHTEKVYDGPSLDNVDVAVRSIETPILSHSHA